MREDSIDAALRRNRPALASLTNRPLKRKLSSILSDSGAKSRDCCAESAEGKDGKHISLQDAKSVKENCKGKFCNKVAPSRFGKGQESGCSPASPVQCDLLNNEAHLVQDDKQRIIDSEPLEVSCLPISVVPTCLEDNMKDCHGIKQNNVVNEEAVDRDLRNDEKDIGFGKVGSSNHDSTELLRLPTFEGSKSLALEMRSGLKTDNCANLDICGDLLKTCSCAFCLKASYIWSDLHYQDIKGRISALKKSQKDASILALKCSKEKETYRDHGSSSGSKLEFDLCGQWMSLFRHMEDMFAQEGSQLQTSFVTLKDLREECKMNLEMLNGMPMQNQ